MADDKTKTNQDLSTEPLNNNTEQAPKPNASATSDANQTAAMPDELEEFELDDIQEIESKVFA